MGKGGKWIWVQGLPAYIVSSKPARAQCDPFWETNKQTKKILLAIHPEMELKGCIILFLIFNGLVYNNSKFPKLWPIFCFLLVFFKVIIILDVRWYLFSISVYISLILIVFSIFSCLLVICIYFLEKYL